jgi:hypothetical protein
MDIFQHPRIQAYLIIPFSLLLIQLLGHYGLFWGHTFIVEEDLVATSLTYNSENTKTMGWRPDIGYGISFFFADPGLQHVWSLLRWWHSLFFDQVLASTINILLTLWFVSIAHYLLLKKVFPKLKLLTLIFLASLISFGPLRHEFLFNGGLGLIFISIPLAAIILFNFLEQPSIRQYFLYTLVIFFSLFLGNSMVLIYVLLFSGLFFISYALYHWKLIGIKDIWLKLTRFTTLHFFSGLTMIFLGAWVFYSIYIEYQVSAPIRDTITLSENLTVPLDLWNITRKFFYHLHAGIFSLEVGFLGIGQFLVTHSWDNVIPLFPIVFIFILFIKSKNFWEFTAKFLVISLSVFHEIVHWFPNTLSYLHAILNPAFYDSFHPLKQILQIVLIGMFINNIGENQNQWVSKKNNWVLSLSIVLSLLYGSLLIFAISVQTMSGFLIQNTNAILPFLSSLGITSEVTPIILNLVRENIRLLNEYMGFSYVLFYATTFGLFIIFTSRQWISFGRWKNGLIFSVALLVCNIFLSWSIYPLNKEQLVWDKQIINQSSPSFSFKKTDRTAWIGIPYCRGSADYFKCIQNKFLNTTSKPQRYTIGYRTSPVLNFSGAKSHTPIEQFLYAKSILHRENIDLKEIRYFASQPAIPNSKIYDLSAVNYFISAYPLLKSEHLEPIHKSDKFFLYRNKKAWPYFYLADQIQNFDSYDDLYDAQKGVAYLKEETVPTLPSPHRRELKLIEFNYGDLKFNYSSDENEFLVITDAWHPYWRASINNVETKVFKTNGIFKGVLLPPGEGSIHLFFDHSKYLPGIWISLFAWAIFIFSWFKTHRNHEEAH